MIRCDGSLHLPWSEWVGYLVTMSLFSGTKYCKMIPVTMIWRAVLMRKVTAQMISLFRIFVALIDRKARVIQKETNSNWVPVVTQVSGQTRSGRNIVRSFSHCRDFFVLVNPYKWTVWKCSPICSGWLKEINSPPRLCLFILVTSSSFLNSLMIPPLLCYLLAPGINIEWSLIVQYTNEPSQGIRSLARTTVTGCNGYRKQQMTSINALRMSVMFANRRPLRTDRKWNYHSVLGYQGFTF